MKKNQNYIKELSTPHAKAYFSLVGISTYIDCQIKEALKPYNLTHAQLNVLSVLYRAIPEPIALSEIKDQLLVASPDMSRLVDRLVKKEWVVRITCPSNRRKVDITLSATGKKMYEKAHASARDHVGEYFRNELTIKEAKQLFSLLQKIKK